MKNAILKNSLEVYWVAVKQLKLSYYNKETATSTLEVSSRSSTATQFRVQESGSLASGCKSTSPHVPSLQDCRSRSRKTDMGVSPNQEVPFWGVPITRTKIYWGTPGDLNFGKLPKINLPEKAEHELLSEALVSKQGYRERQVRAPCLLSSAGLTKRHHGRVTLNPKPQKPKSPKPQKPKTPA